VVSGQEREETGKSLRRTLEEDEGELKREDADDRGVSMKSSSWWQVMEVGTT
jgi:hypothetical protein